MFVSVQWGSYDFIIVGAGSSGSVLTNRLTESGKFKVLVLEAGSYENDITDIPSFAGALMSSDFNWGYKTVPQTTACLGNNNSSNPLNPIFNFNRLNTFVHLGIHGLKLI